MKRHWRKGAIALVAFVLVAFVATSAMAIVLNARSEEMTANSTCDLAGTVDLKFNETDYNRITNYLMTENFVLIRATLGGQNIELTADEPRLCKDIIGDTSADGAQGEPLPNTTDLVELDDLDIEVSDIADGTLGGTADGNADVTAYVYGKSGNQYFSIYLTDIQEASNWDDERTWPWIKVGLFQNVDVPTSICADVNDFGSLAILNVSLDIEPTQLTYTTSDNQIGHFLRQDIEFRACDEKDGEFCTEDDATTIPLCDLTEQETCDTYYKCIVAEGTYPSSGTISVTVRSNGATNGANTQEGVYIAGVTLYNDLGQLIAGDGWEYYQANGTTEVTSLNCTFLAENAYNEVNAAQLDGDIIQFCIAYQVNADDVTRDADGEILNPTVQFWIELASVPCGDLLNEPIDAATLVECGAEPNCMYFPYVLHGYTAAPGSIAWFSGIAVTNLSEVPVEDMEVTVTLTDSTGAAFTDMIPADMITGKVFAFSADGLIAAMGWEPADGPAWLMVQGNFTMDGYSFNFEADNGFGAGTLPRLLEDCDHMDALK